MMSFSKDADSERPTLAIIDLYLVSLLDMGKSSRMTCSILSLIGALSCKPTPAPV